MAGPFLWVGDEKLWLRGVTYGTFAPNRAGDPFPEPDVVLRDLDAMQAHGFNTVRTYAPPPPWMLDAAAGRGLRVLVGLPWEQHVAFLADRDRPARIERAVRLAVRRLARHPALLGFAVGNEIPAGVVRWHGRRKVTRFLERLVRAAKAEDPGALVTYVNYPTTEYLDVAAADFVSFNVYLERRETFEAYLARLQTLAADRPLVMAELGLDSRRHGLTVQADALAWQIDASFTAGCAGCTVFAWTDEWWRGGHPIEDWDFGLVDRGRVPKPALAAVEDAFARAPFGPPRAWPRVSVAICSYNGAATIADTLEGATALDYPEYEVIVVDDGSRDATGEIARRSGVRVVRTENRGLSAARNAALAAATGDLVAYVDDDARPDRDWLRYLVLALERYGAAAVGGPNLAPDGDGLVAECVANAPGGPVHVLIDDVRAEHLPGCNLAVRREVLHEVGGWDPRFRAAGDDVDLCWRIQDRGHRIVFSPAALVWHHRRRDVGTYWRQQRGYGTAEALLERKWPQRYNGLGHLRWAGVLYGRGLVQALQLLPERVYHGRWGTAAYQGAVRRPAGVAALGTMPEWLLLLPPLAAVTLLGAFWPPLRLAVVLLAVATAVPLAQAVLGAVHARFSVPPGTRTGAFGGVARRALTGVLHLIQPAARLAGRLTHGLTPWRRRGPARPAWPWPRRYRVWSETWRAPEAWLTDLSDELRARGARIRTGGPFDRWDLEVVGGLAGSLRLLALVEEHGRGRQLWRLRTWPRVAPSVLVSGAILLALAAAAGVAGAPLAATGLAVLASAPAVIGALDLAACHGTVDAIMRTEPEGRAAFAHD